MIVQCPALFIFLREQIYFPVLRHSLSRRLRSVFQFPFVTSKPRFSLLLSKAFKYRELSTSLQKGCFFSSYLSLQSWTSEASKSLSLTGHFSPSPTPMELHIVTRQRNPFCPMGFSLTFYFFSQIENTNYSVSQKQFGNRLQVSAMWRGLLHSRTTGGRITQENGKR